MSAISEYAEPKGEDTMKPAVFVAKLDSMDDVLKAALPVGLVAEEDN